MSETVTPPIVEVPESDADGRDGRPFLFAGLALIALAFLFAWWSLTKYRVADERGVPPEKLGSIEAELDEVEKAVYRDEKARYSQSWSDNVKQYGDFYKEQVDERYETQLQEQINRSFKSGTISIRGWSTWTGWFGATFVVFMVAGLVLPKFVPSLEPWAWGVPWAGAILFGLYSLMALVFYFSVPDENGDGYSQGVSLGNYLAILGGGLATAGCIFEGMRTIDQGIAMMKARSEAASDDEDEVDDDDAEPAPPPKNRLQDW